MAQVTRPRTQVEVEAFGEQLANNCDTHEQWIIVVRFGLETFLKNQPMFFEVIWREAIRQLQRRQIDGDLAVQARLIFQELGLRFG
jgi:hypothetical protein